MTMMWTRRIKNSILFFLVMGLALGCQASVKKTNERGLFVSLIQDPPVLTSREDIQKLIQFAHTEKIRVLFVQVYRAGQAWFPSAHADSAPYEKALQMVGEDPLALLIREAHTQGIEVHTWLNMLSLSENIEAPILKKYGTDILTQKPGPDKKTIEDYKIDNQYFLEPGDLRVREEFAQMIEEIAKNYPDLDGIQLDYIRYPDAHPFYGYTPNNIARFKAAKGEVPVEESNIDWKNWRREQVTELVALLRQRALQINPQLKFSTTGCAPYIRALEEAFQDWPKWRAEGLADFVTVMTYPKTVSEFEKQLEGLKKNGVDLGRVNIAIGAYKLLDSPDIFSKQVRICEDSGARSCVFFHYGNFIEQPILVKALEQKEVS